MNKEEEIETLKRELIEADNYTIIALHQRNLLREENFKLKFSLPYKYNTGVLYVL